MGAKGRRGQDLCRGQKNCDSASFWWVISFNFCSFSAFLKQLHCFFLSSSVGKNHYNLQHCDNTNQIFVQLTKFVNFKLQPFELRKALKFLQWQ